MRYSILLADRIGEWFCAVGEMMCEQATGVAKTEGLDMNADIRSAERRNGAARQKEKVRGRFAVCLVLGLVSYTTMGRGCMCEL